VSLEKQTTQNKSKRRKKMKTAKITLVLIMVLFTGSKLFSQMPKPAESKFFEQMVGTWTGVVDSPWGKSNSEAVCEWGLNHQFVVVKVKSSVIDNPSMTYEATEYYQPAADGKFSFWIFNVHGEVSTGTGTASDSKAESTSSSAMGKSSGVMSVNGSEMSFNENGTYLMNGQNVNYTMTGTFKKK
jgi:hypothetical protein